MTNNINNRRIPFWMKFPEYDLPIKLFFVAYFVADAIGQIRRGGDLFGLWVGFDCAFGYFCLKWAIRDVLEIRRQLKVTAAQKSKAE